MQLSPADVDNIVASVEATVNTIQQDQGGQPQQQNNAPAGQAPAGGQPGKPGGPAAGGDAAGGGGTPAGGTGPAGAGTAPGTDAQALQQTTDAGTQTGTQTGTAPAGTPAAPGAAPAPAPAPAPTPAPAVAPAPAVTPAPTPTVAPAPAPVVPPPPPPPPIPAQLTVTCGETVLDQGPNVAEFTITRSANLSSSVTVSYTVGGGSATAGTDYAALTGAVTFAAGETTKQIADFLTGSNDRISASRVMRIEYMNRSAGCRLKVTSIRRPPVPK